MTLAVSWNLITKNCASGIERSLRSLRPFLRPGDEVLVLDTGSTDGTQDAARAALASVPGVRAEILERPDLCDPDITRRMAEFRPELFAKYGSHPQFQSGCIANFAATREIVRLASRNPVLGWIDADDVIEGNPDALFRGMEDFFARGGDSFFLLYEYAHDARDGVPTTTLWRERLVMRERFRWVGACHEVLLPDDGAAALRSARSGDARVVHHHEERKHHVFSDLRNYAILRTEMERQGGPERCDPRILLYLGNACRGMLDLDEAEHYYRIFIPRSGSQDDRVLAALYLGNIYAYEGRVLSALRAYRLAEECHPNDPRPHFAAQVLYAAMKDHREVIRQARRGQEKLAVFDTVNAVDPTKLNTEPYLHLAEALKETGQYQAALDAASRAAAARPQCESLQRWARALEREVNDLAYVDAVTTTLSRSSSLPNTVRILQSIELPEVALRRRLASPETTINRDGRRTIALLCGPTIEKWAPGDEHLAGVGGSERMVIEMAKRLQRRGLAVTVYADIPSKARGGLIEGVLWRHTAEFNPLIPRDYLVAWRNPSFLGLPVSAKRRYVWLHDAVGNAPWTKQTLSLIDRAILLSSWHRACCSAIPDDKVYLSRNGIDVELIRKVEVAGVARDVTRFVWASSPERGLDVLLSLWPRVLQLCPEARLDILYGFTPTYIELIPHSPFVTVGGQPQSRMAYMDTILSVIRRLPGVTYHGRLPAEGVIRAMFSASALLYPATFDETFCIAAAEAQACGTIPLVFDRGALATTVRNPAWRVPPDDHEAFVCAVKDHLLFPPPEEDRRRVAEAARADFDLDTLADEWVRDLFT